MDEKKRALIGMNVSRMQKGSVAQQFGRGFRLDAGSGVEGEGEQSNKDDNCNVKWYKNPLL